MKDAHDILIVNGVRFPAPDAGFEILQTQVVNAGRNAANEVVGQKVGRRIWKLEGLQWTGLDAQTWAEMKAALEDFFVPVTFTGDDNVRHTIHMYPGDTSGRPMPTTGIFYQNFETCKFSLIDCGWNE